MFASLVRRKEERLDLAMAALLIAREEYPRLSIEDYMERLDYLGAEYAIDLPVDLTPELTCRTLVKLLAGVHGFRGNAEAYYDPANSYLNEVLDHRTGIPITLSIVYIEVARRAGIVLVPVSFPGHFLVRHAYDMSFYIDPFNNGRILSLDDCREMLAKSHPHTAFSESMLGAADEAPGDHADSVQPQGHLHARRGRPARAAGGRAADDGVAVGPRPGARPRDPVLPHMGRSRGQSRTSRAMRSTRRRVRRWSR